MPNYVYEVSDPKSNLIKRTNKDTGEISHIPPDPGNRDYIEFIQSKAALQPFNSPALNPAAYLDTLTDKLARVGLTIDDIKQATLIVTPVSVQPTIDPLPVTDAKV